MKSIVNIKSPNSYVKDRRMFNQVKLGDKVAFTELYDLYASPLFGIILKWVKDKEIAVEIFQDCFLSVWEKCKKEDFPKSSIIIWMCKIAIEIIQNDKNIETPTKFTFIQSCKN